ncbi:MAG: hypothetical protein ACFHWZ_09925 [Phycisphaerales bacterium]
MHASTVTPSFFICWIFSCRSLSAASRREDGPHTISVTSPAQPALRGVRVHQAHAVRDIRVTGGPYHGELVHNRSRFLRACFGAGTGSAPIATTPRIAARIHGRRWVSFMSSPFGESG